MTVDDVAALLETAGHGVAGTDIFGYLGDDPDAATIITPTGGSPGTIRLPSSNPIDRVVTFQVLARARTDAAAEVRARSAYAAIHTRHETIPGAHLQWMQAIQEPARLPPDGRGRHRWVFNIEARTLA